MTRIIYSIFIILLICNSGFSQPENTDAYRCYRTTVDQGLENMRKGDFGLALQQFTAAYTCNYEAGKDSLQLLINQSGESLNIGKKLAEENEKLALENEAEQKRLKEKAQAERDAKDAALVREGLAKLEVVKQGQRAESRRLLDLAGKVNEENTYNDALLMAFLGLEMGGKDVYNSGMKVFGTLVRDSFSKVEHSSNVTIDQLVLLPVADKLMTISPRRVDLIDRKNTSNLNSISMQMEDLSDYSISPVNNELLFWSGTSASRYSSEGNLIEKINHRDNIVFATYAHEDEFLITCSRDNKAILHNLKSKSSSLDLIGHVKPIYQAAFSHDNKYLFTRSSDLVIVWNTKGKKIAELGSNEVYIYDATFNTNCDKIATATADGKVKVWSLDGKLIKAYDDHRKAVKQVDYSSKPERLISRSIKTFKCRNRNTLVDFPDLANTVKGMQMDHQGSSLILWGKQQLLQQFNLKSKTIQQFKGLENNVKQAAFSFNDQYVLTNCKDYSSQLWDSEGQLLISWFSIYQYPLSPIFNGDSKTVYILSDDRKKILSCPMPDMIYQKMKSNSGKLKKEIAQLQRKYELEFLEGFD